MFCRFNFRLGVHTVIPLYMDVVRTMSVGNLEPINMVIGTSQLTQLQIAISAQLSEIIMLLAAQNNVDSTTMETLNPGINELVIAARNELPSQMRISADAVEQIRMVLTAYETDPDAVIHLAKDAAIHNNLVISAKNDLEIHPTIQLEEMNNDLVIHVGDGIEIGPIRKTLGELSNLLEMADAPFDLALAISVLEDGQSGNLNLVLQACDDTGVVITHPVLIGSIDPKKIGTLDPYAVPDATTE